LRKYVEKSPSETIKIDLSGRSSSLIFQKRFAMTTAGRMQSAT
jgi:hypothetical protein